MMRGLLCGLLLLAYAFIIIPFSDLQKSRPVEVKLGYLPHAQLLKVTSGEHRSTVAATIMMRVLFYFGTVIEKLMDQVIINPEFYNLFKTLQRVVELDPYNMDSYYFAQAIFTWELGRIDEVNYLLEQGMKYRPWDQTLPFYIGFNSAFFLKDYPKAATYMQKAAEISGNPLYTQLAARYFYESQQTALGLAFLETMIRSAKDKAVRENYKMRRDALLATTVLEKALKTYRAETGSLPESLMELVEAGLLDRLPDDPYGGEFYLDDQGRVRTTSKLSEPLEEKGMQN